LRLCLRVNTLGNLLFCLLSFLLKEIAVAAFLEWTRAGGATEPDNISVMGKPTNWSGSMQELKKAAEILDKCKRLLILTGAGMSADSGIPTFRDANGIYRDSPFGRQGLRPERLSNGACFLEDPEMSWPYYEWRRNLVIEQEPHEGYQIINSLVKDRDVFVITTNADGYHIQSGIDLPKIYEVHGTMRQLQFLDGARQWVEVAPDTSLCEVDKTSLRATRMPTRRLVSRGILWPRTLRPNVKMFNDRYYVKNHSQIRALEAWRQGGQPDVALVIGANIAVPTTLHLAEHVKALGGQIITIDIAKGYKAYNADLHVQMGAKRALLELGLQLKCS
jgi:NAD-dependent SIR2 family protein deacetylase